MWRNPQGYAVIVDPDAGKKEYDTATCFHCQRILLISARTDPADMGGLCKVCMKLICPGCVGKACVPFEKSIEKAEAKAAARASYGF